jgi:replication fork protection complex subunit Tof1/Swi1
MFQEEAEDDLGGERSYLNDLGGERSYLNALGDEQDQADVEVDRFDVFMPVATTLTAALGGYEQVETSPGVFETIYRPGDSVLGVLKDLKRLWRKDDTDDERTVARCFYQAGLMKELVALLAECTERGEWGRKIALVVCESGGR